VQEVELAADFAEEGEREVLEIRPLFDAAALKGGVTGPMGVVKGIGTKKRDHVG